MKSIYHLASLLAIFICTGEVKAQLVFIDRAPETGTTNTSFGRGTAMVDIDGDGLLDLVTSNAEMPNGFFRQLPDHTFVDASSEWGIAFDERSTWGVLVADFDNDGDPDVYFINGGFIVPPVANQLLRNDLNTIGVLTDVSGTSGDADNPVKNFGGTALDYDRDGDLDIFLTTTEANETCILLRNDGNLYFTDVSPAAGIVDLGSFRHCSSGDFNNDGWMDIAVGGFDEANILYRNNGDGTFVNVAATAGVESPGPNFGLVLEDFDNDGWMDIYVPKYHKVPAGPSELFRNNGDGTFTDVTVGSGTTSQTDMGHNTGDLDADGYPDIYIGTGVPGSRLDDVLFLITLDGMGGFIATDVSDSSGITSNGPTRCHGIALGDYDQDGFVDVYTNNGGVPNGPPDSLQENALWQNQGNANNWTALHLTGRYSNRSAVGTRCVAITNTGREIHRCLRVGNGFANTDSPIQHFGIGLDQSIERIVINWPSGLTQTIFNPPMSQVTEVIECEIYGDVDHNDEVNLSDLLCMLDGMRGIFNCSAVTFGDLDIFPCGGDGDINLYDLLGILDALAAPPVCVDLCP